MAIRQLPPHYRPDLLLGTRSVGVSDHLRRKYSHSLSLTNRSHALSRSSQFVFGRRPSGGRGSTMWATPFSMRNLWSRTGKRQKKLSCKSEKNWLSILCSDEDVSVTSSSQNSWQIALTYSVKFVRPPLINFLSSFASSGSAGFFMHCG